MTWAELAAERDFAKVCREAKTLLSAGIYPLPRDMKHAAFEVLARIGRAAEKRGWVYEYNFRSPESRAEAREAQRLKALETRPLPPHTWSKG